MLSAWQAQAGAHTSAPPWLFVAVPVWFCFVNFLIARYGWPRLSNAHPGGPAPPPGRTFKRCSGKIGPVVSYKSCLNVTLSSQGIYVVPMWLFRLFHPPLLLPWSGVQSVEEKRSLFWRYALLVFTDPGGPRFALYLPADALETIHAMSGRADFSALRMH